MRLTNFICCEFAIQDIRTGGISLINVFEQISAVAFPAVVGRVTAVAMFERELGEPENQPTRLEAHLNEQQVLGLDAVANFQGQTRTKLLAEMQGVPVTAPGDLKFAIWAGDPMREVGSWTIKIEIVGAPRVDLFSAAAAPPPPDAPNPPST
jgi:hypothetical protein